MLIMNIDSAGSKAFSLSVAKKRCRIALFMRILITGTTGNSMPPPYAGVPKIALLCAREWRQKGHDVAITFTYRPKNADELGAGATYFFEYSNKPGKLQKLWFLCKYFFASPALYIDLWRAYRAICPHVTREMYLYSAYGVYLDHVYSTFKPDVVLSEAALIKTFMAAKIAKRHNVPIMYNVYAEVRDMGMGENKHLTEDQRKTYWLAYLNMADLVIGMANCTVEMKAYVPRERLVAFWDPNDFEVYSQPISESKEELRAHFNLPKKMFLACAVGSFELRKGHDQLIRSVALAVKQGLDAGIVICGSLGSHAKWREIARAEGVEDRAFFFTSLSELELVKLLNAVDVNTNLSNTQRCCGLDMGLLEGMAAALPVIVYDTGALPGAVRGNSENGYVVPMNEVEGVAEAIGKLIAKTPEERAAMGKISQEIARRRDIKIYADLRLRWFKEALEKKNNPSVQYNHVV
jgi:glycosyltransferase involved in cell wall biosynthesis